MEKVYYKGLKIKKGFEFNYHGLKTVVTQELIDNNPELFSTEEGSYMDLWVYMPSIKEESFKYTQELEAYKQELLDEAKRRYPVGTVYKHFNSEYTINSPDMLTVSEMDHHFVEGATSFETSIWVDSGAYNGVVYENGKWAEILPLKFTSEDGVKIYGDMKTWIVDHFNGLSSQDCFDGLEPTYKYFYHKENALAYIEKHKEKTLEDYENMLLRTDIDSINAREVCWFYHILKKKEPKLYYTKILQLIADDLNDVRYIHERGQASFHINKGGVNLHMGADEGAVYFKSKELAEKARDIMGNKLEYLFN